jgi:hypothetical protein
VLGRQLGHAEKGEGGVGWAGFMVRKSFGPRLGKRKEDLFFIFKSFYNFKLI